MFRIFSALVFLFALYIVAPHISSAQAIIGGTPLYLTINPENPSPEESVTASVQSYSTDLNAADISWFINSSLIRRGTGLKTITFQTGKAGSESVVSVVIQSSEGFVLESELVVRPARVSLVWEADTYTPPFYKGKALYGHQSTLHVTALPDFVTQNGTRRDPSRLVYRWKQNGSVMSEASGFGKQTFSFEGTVITRPFTVDVEVTDPNSTLKGVASLRIASSEPKLLMYEDSPLYGIRFSKALSGIFNLDKEEATLGAVPYFFSVESPEALDYTWIMNSRELGSKNSAVTFRNETGESGVSNLSVKAENKLKFLQFGSQNTSIQFEAFENSTDSIF